MASTTAGFIPFDGDFIAGDEATPMDVRPQIEERRTPGLAPLARQRFAGLGVEQKGNRGMREVVVALLAFEVRATDHLRHGIGLMQHLHPGKAHDFLAPVLRRHHTFGATGGDDVGIGIKDRFQAALQTGLGHVVQ
ncbi:hypothetical protein D3C81_1186050 [compost metagenome]